MCKSRMVHELDTKMQIWRILFSSFIFSNNHEISCVVPSHFASGYSTLTHNSTNYSTDVFTVNVAIVVGNDNIELPLYSVHIHLAKLQRKPVDVYCR